MWLSLLAYLATFALAVVAYFKWSFGYWKRRGIPYLQSSIPFGTMNNPLTLSESIADNVYRQYTESKALGFKYVGLYGLTVPQFMVIDPEIIKSVLIKDFHHFTDRGFYYNEKDDPLSAHLFTLAGQKWKRLRAKFTPTFTAAKMRTMTEFVVSCGHQLKNALNDRYAQGPVDIKDLLERYTTNVIGSCAFGIECNSFTDPNNEFCEYTKKQFHPTAFHNFKMFISFMFPEFAELIRMKVVTEGVTNFFMKTVKESVAMRRKTAEVRNDFLQILIGLMDAEDDHGAAITIEECAAQAFIFFLAGFETSSSTMSFCLYELSLRPDLQQRVRDEINDVLKKHDGEITYESLKELIHLTSAIDETLRKYPPLPVLNRKCVSDYKIPNTELTITKGTNVTIPLIGLQRDPDYFPNPMEFDPERFSKKTADSIKPFTYMPFGEGNRICLGLRFGVMQTRIGLLLLLKHFKFSLNNKTATPLELEPISFVLSVKGGIWLNAEKINA